MDDSTGNEFPVKNLFVSCEEIFLYDFHTLQILWILLMNVFLTFFL
jgi:hypothetical protein